MKKVSEPNILIDVVLRLIGIVTIVIIELCPMQMYTVTFFPDLNQFFRPKTPIFWGIFSLKAYAIRYSMLPLVFYVSIFVILLGGITNDFTILISLHGVILWISYPFISYFSRFMFKKLGTFIIPEYYQFTFYFFLVWLFSLIISLLLVFISLNNSYNKLSSDENNIFQNRVIDQWKYNFGYTIIGLLIGSQIFIEVGYKIMQDGVIGSWIMQIILLLSFSIYVYRSFHKYENIFQKYTLSLYILLTSSLVPLQLAHFSDIEVIFTQLISILIVTITYLIYELLN